MKYRHELYEYRQPPVFSSGVILSINKLADTHPGAGPEKFSDVTVVCVYVCSKKLTDHLNSAASLTDSHLTLNIEKLYQCASQHKGCGAPCTNNLWKIKRKLIKVQNINYI